MKQNYQIIEEVSRVYHVQFEHCVDTAMHFLRFQEYYESANEQFYRKPFFIMDFIEWYSKDRNNVFSYPSDWSGFNVPGFVFEKFYRGFFVDELAFDINKYDKKFELIISEIKKKYNIPSYDWNFYIIGTTKTKESKNTTLNHEIAHGLYSTNNEYKNEMLALIENLPTKFKNIFFDSFTEMGYNQEVHLDELQAYLSSSTTKYLLKTFKKINEKDIKLYQKKFILTFKKYNVKSSVDNIKELE